MSMKSEERETLVFEREEKGWSWLVGEVSLGWQLALCVLTSRVSLSVSVLCVSELRREEGVAANSKKHFETETP